MLKVVVLGFTCSGKSSLINSFLEEEKAKTSSIKPETKGFNSYEKDGIIYVDTEGYELKSNSDELIKNLVHHIFLRDNKITVCFNY